MRIPRLFGRGLAKGDADASPKTYAKTSGKKRNTFERRERDSKLLDRLDTFYAQGGPVAEAIDSYPLCILSPGWTLEGPEELVKKVKEVYDRIDFESVCWQLIVESLKVGDGIAEIVKGRGSMSEDVVAIYVRAAKDFDIEHDEHGKIVAYRQIIKRNAVQSDEVTLLPEEVLRLSLMPQAGSVYGASILQRAYDDIERDTDIADATTAALKAHGFRKFHSRVGKEGDSIPPEEIEEISQEFDKLLSGKVTNITTQRDVDILPLDAGELTITGYYEWTTDRLCTALGVPEEILGLGRGSTEATANVRRKAWNDKIGAFQRKVARVFDMQLNDRITGKPGAVRLKFGDVDPEDESKVADLIMKLMGNAADPEMIISAKMARKRLGYDEKEYQADIEAEYAESAERTPEQLKPFVPGGEQAGKKDGEQDDPEGEKDPDDPEGAKA